MLGEHELSVAGLFELRIGCFDLFAWDGSHAHARLPSTTTVEQVCPTVICVSERPASGCNLITFLKEFHYDEPTL